MSINLTIPGDDPGADLKPKITVVGVGGAGGNAVNNMIASQLEGVDFVVANTDAQALNLSQTDHRIQLGMDATQGLGAGSHPEVGAAAAEEASTDIGGSLEGSHMVFVAAGMGGGTGTGAAPVIARMAREAGILTVGVVTKPFHFEGSHRMRIADAGIEELQRHVDTLIVIPNQNLFRVANEKTTFADAFKMADDVLYSGVRSVTDLMVMPGLINLDFADIRAVMAEMGKAMMGTGEASGEKRALEAAEAAISNPLLEDTSVNGAQGVLINITGGPDMTLFEVDEAANRIRDEVDQDAHIIFGSTFDKNLEGSIRVSVVATGIDGEAAVRPEPRVLEIAQPAIATQKVSEEPLASEAAPEQSLFATVFKQPTAVDAGAEVDSTVEQAEAEEAVRDGEAPSAEGSAEPRDSAEPAAPELTHEPATQEAFIMPAPHDTTGRETRAPNVDPYSAADLTNGGRVAAAASSPVQAVGSLFGRATGLFGKTPPPSLTPQPAAAEPRRAEVAQQQSTLPTTVADNGPVTAAATATAVQSQPEMEELIPSRRAALSDDEDDMLDIPAFLRRQAN